MKKISLAPLEIRGFLMGLLIASLVLVGFAGGALAQEVQEPVPLIPVALPELPAPGLMPGDFFYFLDEWRERIEEFFIFRAEDRALLQAERALERIAEVKALLEEKGVEAPGLAVAEEKIQQNMARAAKILEQQKNRGREVTQLAKQLDSEFDTRQHLLKAVFRAAKENLRAQEKTLRIQIREARQAGDFEKISQLRANLINIEARKEKMEARKDLLKENLRVEKAKIEVKMEAREREMEALAEEAEDLLDQRERDRDRGFKQKERALNLQEKALEIQLKQAILVGDLTLAEQIRTKLLDLEAQEETLEAEEEVLEEDLEREKEKLQRAIVMKERATVQIEEAREKILDVREKMVEVVEVPPVVLGLIDQAESKLVVAEQAFAEEKYGRAFGQAMAAEMLARNAGRMLEEKEEVVEKLEKLEEELKEADRTEKVLREDQRRLEVTPIEEREELKKRMEETRRQHQERLKEIEESREEVKREKERERKRRRIPERGEIQEPGMPRACQTDWDCRELICPMVIGQDTPQCNEEGGVCFCGPGLGLERPEIPEMPERPGMLQE